MLTIHNAGRAVAAQHPVKGQGGRQARRRECILARDSGKGTRSDSIDKKHLSLLGIVDMPSRSYLKVLGHKMFQAGDINAYEEKAQVAAKSLKSVNAVYVHIKGPDEFGHDGDARGKKQNIEDIDRRFFGTLVQELKGKAAIVVSGDHSTPCVKKGHSDDPVPLLVSGNMVKQDGSARFTEDYGKRGSLGMLMGVEVLPAAIKLVG